MEFIHNVENDSSSIVETAEDDKMEKDRRNDWLLPSCAVGDKIEEICKNIKQEQCTEFLKVT